MGRLANRKPAILVGRMKLTVSKTEFLDGLQAVQNAVSPRSTIPVMSNLLLESGDGQITLTGTDGDLTISSVIHAAVHEPGSITLPSKRIFSITREIASLEIDLEVEPDSSDCSIQAGSTFFKVRGVEADEFPKVDHLPSEKKILVPQDKIKSMLKKTSFAISNDETRYVLNGLYFKFAAGKLILVATDGRRLALVDEPLDFPPESEGSFIVPTKTVLELGRLLQNKGALSIELSENRVAFDLIQEEEGQSVVTSTIISKLIDGSYPDYNQVIPREVEERIALGREEFLQALKRVELMTTDKSGSAKLSFSENNLVISANTPDVGEARESIAINYQGKDLAVAFNPTYLMDPLKALDNDEVFLELTDELSPGVIKINDPFLYVIMPMRLQ